MAHRPGPVFLGIVSLTLCGARQLCGSWMPCFWAKDKNMQKVPVRAIVLVRMSNPTCYVSLWHKLTWFNLWAILKRSMWAILTIWAILSHIYIYIYIIYSLSIGYYLLSRPYSCQPLWAMTKSLHDRAPWNRNLCAA